MEERKYPLICTRGVVVFPNQEVVIDVGRPKSMASVENAQENFEDQVVLFSQKQIDIENPSVDDIYQMGVLCEIRHVRRFDKFLRVKFKGLERVRLVELQQDESEMGLVEVVESQKQDETEEVALVRMLAEAFESMNSGQKFLTKELMLDLSKGIGASQLSDKSIQMFPLSLERKQEYIETLGINDRLVMLLQDIENEKKMAEVEKKINETVKEKIDQGQKEYYLREKMHAIKEELGDVVPTDKDAEGIRRRLEENPYPEYIKNKVKEELMRYETLPQASGETGVIKTYIDWLMDLPWWQETQDNEDLNQAQEILDADHYGL